MPTRTKTCHVLVVNTEIASNIAMTVFGYSDGCVAAARQLSPKCNKLAASKYPYLLESGHFPPRAPVSQYVALLCVSSINQCSWPSLSRWQSLSYCRFITVFTKFFRSFWNFHLILFWHLCLGHPSGLFPWSGKQTMLREFAISLLRSAFLFLIGSI